MLGLTGDGQIYSRTDVEKRFRCFFVGIFWLLPPSSQQIFTVASIMQFQRDEIKLSAVNADNLQLYSNMT